MVESKRRPWYRLHVTSYLTLLLTATAAAVLNLPHQYTPSFETIFFYSNERAVWTDICNSGWPLMFLETREHVRPELAVHSWSFVAFFADVMIAVAFVSVTTGLYEFRRRHRRRLSHVTLSDVMIVMFIACLALACWRGLVTQYDARQAVVQQIQDGGGHVGSALLLPQALARTDVTDKTARARAWCRNQLADSLYFLKQPLFVSMPANEPRVWSSLRRLEEVRVLTYRCDKPRGSIQKFISNLPKLERLSLSGLGITDGDAQAISRLPELRGLALTNTAITDQGLAHIARRLPLVDLDLNGTKITDVGLSQVARITQLRELNLSNTAVTSAGFEQLHGHPSLRTLSYFMTAPDPAFAPCEIIVLKNMPRLESVRLRMPLARLHLENLPRLERLPSSSEDRFIISGGMGRFSYWQIDVAQLTLRKLPSLASLFINAQNLNRLEITDTERLHEFVVRDRSYPRPTEGYNIDDVTAGVIGGITSLTSLVLPKARLTPSGWAKLATLPNLKSLDLTGTNVQDSDLAHFADLTRLEELSLSETGISDAGWQCLPDLPRLAHLALRNSRVTCFYSSGLDELNSLDLSGSPIHELRLTGLHQLTGTLQLKGNQIEVLELTDLPRLEYLSLPRARVHSLTLNGLIGLTRLDLSHTNAADDWLTDVGRWSSLHDVRLRGTQVTDAALAGIGTLENLNRLDLEETAVTDAGLEKLKDIVTINVLNLTGTSVSDDGLAHLAGWRNLELLYLGRTRVRGPGLVHLRNLPALYKLSLGVTRVDSNSLAALRGLRNLRWLRLSDTRIDDRAFNHLQTLAGLDTLLLNGTAITNAGFSKSSLPASLRFLDLQDTEVSEATIRQWRRTPRRLKIESGASQRGT